MKKTQAELCAVNMGEELRYMGTANVVRDIEFMTRTLEGDEALMFVRRAVFYFIAVTQV